MQRYVVTGAPGAGKTSVLRQLRAQGFTVVDEAATDVIAREQQRGVAEPWRDTGFVTLITGLQHDRLGRSGKPARQQRSWLVSGGCGIRTHGDDHSPQRFSRPPPSATRRTLRR